jgi:hypothetical protein
LTTAASGAPGSARRGGDRAFDLPGFRQVGLHHLRALELRCPPVEHDHAPAVARERFHDGAPEPTRAARDQRGAIHWPGRYPLRGDPVRSWIYVSDPMVVRELTDGQELDCVLLVRERRLRTERDGSEILQLTLGDRTGSIAAVVSDGVADLSAACDCGAAVRVQGRYSSRGERIAIRSLRAARADEVDLDALLDGPPRGAEQMEADMRALIGTVQSVHLRALLEAVLGAGSDSWGRFRDAPAAKRYHQAYRHGLLEHSLSVAQSVSAIAANFPGIDRDVAVCGALLHDIGKLDAYTADPLRST